MMSTPKAGASTTARNSKDVDAYLRSLPTGDRSALEKMRQAIRSAAPDADEGFSYGLPAFRLAGRPLVCYGAAKSHCSFFPMSPALIRAFSDDLKAYDISKGTIRFTPERPLPARLVQKFVRARIAELRKVRQ